MKGYIMEKTNYIHIVEITMKKYGAKTSKENLYFSSKKKAIDCMEYFTNEKLKNENIELRNTINNSGKCYYIVGNRLKDNINNTRIKIVAYNEEINSIY